MWPSVGIGPLPSPRSHYVGVALNIKPMPCHLPEQPLSHSIHWYTLRETGAHVNMRSIHLLMHCLDVGSLSRRIKAHVSLVKETELGSVFIAWTVLMHVRDWFYTTLITVCMCCVVFSHHTISTEMKGNIWLNGMWWKHLRKSDIFE